MPCRQPRSASWTSRLRSTGASSSTMSRTTGRPAGSRGGLNLPCTGPVASSSSSRAGSPLAISSSISVSSARLAGPVLARWRASIGLCGEAVCGTHLSQSQSRAVAGEANAATTSSAGECRATTWTTTAGRPRGRAGADRRRRWHRCAGVRRRPGRPRRRPCPRPPATPRATPRPGSGRARAARACCARAACRARAGTRRTRGHPGAGSTAGWRRCRRPRRLAAGRVLGLPADDLALLLLLELLDHDAEVLAELDHGLLVVLAGGAPRLEDVAEQHRGGEQDEQQEHRVLERHRERHTHEHRHRGGDPRRPLRLRAARAAPARGTRGRRRAARSAATARTAATCRARRPDRCCRRRPGPRSRSRRA